MPRYLSGVIVVAVVCALASCTESGLLTPLSGQTSQAKIQSVANGTMVTSGDQLALSVQTDPNQSPPSDLKVELLSSSGAVVQTANITNVDFSSPLPSLLLPTLQTGTYTMQLTLDGSDGTMLAQKKINLFYVDGTYQLDGIDSYPPALPPGGSGLLVARITAPQDAKPYLRWSMGSTLIGEGYLADGYDKMQWTAPKNTGVYSITVELFPFGPQPGASFDYTSPYMMKVEVFVTSSVKANRSELGPSDSYYALYHLQGSLKDSGALGADLTKIGTPVLSASGSVLGYQLNGSNGFRIPAFLLPTSNDGTLRPFSITMRLRLDSVEPSRNFFSASSGSFNFAIASTATGSLSAVVNNQPESGSASFPTTGLHTLTLSAIPTGSALDLLWFIDGELKLFDNSLPAPPKITPQSGTTTIAGQNGFSGLLDEAGVYYRNPQDQYSADPEVFRRAMDLTFDGNLLFAEGFDAATLPSDLAYTGSPTDSQVGTGVMLLAPSQSAATPFFGLGEEEATIDLELPGYSAGGGGKIVLVGRAGDQLSIDPAKAEDSSGRVELTVSKVGGKILVSGNGVNETLPGAPSELSVRIENDGTAAFAVRSILIVKGKTKITAAQVSGASAS
ncbi:MAG TPA: hypothetical protein VMV68_05455 [Spirochaetia bacterium]|nr:hypothetical protein [Spirochaetia bacterium]